MNLESLLTDYLTGPRLLREAVSGMTHEQLHARPIAGQWSTHEVVCHLSDSEALYAERFKRVIAENVPTLLDADPDVWMPRLACPTRDVVEETQLVDQTRRQMGRIFKTLRPEDYARIGNHTVAGPLTLEALLKRAVGHIPHHIRFIEAKRKLLAG